MARRPRNKVNPAKLSVQAVGPLKSADVSFGDLTVLVGPQASGKSVYLQFLKLAVDRVSIAAELRHFGLEWSGDFQSFLNLYLGEGMAGVWSESSRLVRDSERLEPKTLASGRGKDVQRMFYIPAQRVMSMREGLTRPFTEYRSGDPYALRSFSGKLHGLLQNEFAADGRLFPRANRLKEAYRKSIDATIYGGFELDSDTQFSQRRIVLRNGETSLPFGTWSAGQREFTPLLLGLYWLMPPGGASRRDDIEWVVIEEPEMGLHPTAIASVLALVLELLQRGYRVCLSTHSPVVLDLVWALQFIRDRGGAPRDVLKLLGVAVYDTTRDVASAALEMDLRTYAFGADGHVDDISELDTGSDRPQEAGWGGLTDFSSNASEVVSRLSAASRVE